MCVCVCVCVHVCRKNPNISMSLTVIMAQEPLADRDHVRTCMNRYVADHNLKSSCSEQHWQKIDRPTSINSPTLRYRERMFKRAYVHNCLTMLGTI